MAERNADGTFKPGQSGNPGGRKKEWLTQILREYMSITDPRAKQSRAEKVAVALYREAVKGDVQAIKYIFDRIDGKVKEAVELDIPEGLKITLVRKEAGDE